jgi:hypothetical protein
MKARIEAARRAVENAKGRLKRLEKEAREAEKRRACRGCGASMEASGKGRPRVWCDNCRFGTPFKSWFREQYGDRIRVYQREYRRAYRARQREQRAAIAQQQHN